MNFSKGRCILELAQGPLCVAPASHIAGIGMPKTFGHKCVYVCVAPLLLDRSAKNGTDHKLNLSVEACVERPPNIERAGCAFTYASECSVGDGARIRSVRTKMA